MAEQDEPVVIYTGPFPAAGFLKGLLEDAGIETFLWGIGPRAGFGSPLDPEHQFGIKVVIAKRDAARAEPIMQKFKEDKLFGEASYWDSF